MPVNTRTPIFALSALVIAMLTGCASSGGSGVAPVSSPFSGDGSSALGAVHVNVMRVFGDSYSDPSFTRSIGTINWSQQLQARGLVTHNANYAIGGARASTGEVRAFDQQINKALSSKTAIADGDLTVIYLGHNDIGHTGSPDGLARATRGYKEGVARLIQAGAANENRRIFVTQLTNWARGPGVADGTAGQVRAWNSMLAGIANENPNIIAVDMYTPFERVFADPAAYGFTNVTTPSPSRAGIDALYHDTTHFGNRGQEIITRVYQHYLTRGWDWANTISAGADASAQINKDIDDGTLVLGLAGQENLKYGFRLLPLGMSEANPLTYRPRSSNVFRPFSTVSTADQSTPNGLALDVGLGSETKPNAGRVGVAVYQLQQPNDLVTAQERYGRRYSANALSLYWHQPAEAFQFTSKLSHLNLQYASQAQDDMVKLNLQNRSTGDTWSLENTLRFPMASAGWDFTPWVSLTGQSHRLDSANVKSLYTTDVRYGGVQMGELLSGLGINAQCKPIYLSGGKALHLGGSLSHTTSLYREAVRVSMEEAGTPGVVQSEVFQSPRINRTQLALQASLDVAKRVQLSATYGAQLQKVSDTSSVMLMANVRY
jgi:lysophospholipase L1-like esterase